jgi:hypothetical protein
MEEDEQVTAEEVMGYMLNDLVPSRHTANQAAARLADGIRDALAFAAANPHMYTDLTGDDGLRAAEAAVLLEVALRVQLPEAHIRNLAHVAKVARADLPELWRRAREGFAPFSLVEATVDALVRLRPAAQAPDAEREASTAAIAMVDSQASDWTLALTPGAFRRRLRILLDRLDARDTVRRHVDALSERRAIVDDPEDGMAWIHLLVPAIEAIAFKRRATSTAKHLQKRRREGRTRDQIRADLASAWLRGEGTPSATKVKVFVTVPVGLTTGTFVDEHGACTICGGSGWAEQARIVGGPTLDPLTAKQVFLDATSYRRLITDPVRGVIVDLDRRSYSSSSTAPAPVTAAPASPSTPTPTTSSNGPAAGRRTWRRFGPSARPNMASVIGRASDSDRGPTAPCK